MSDYIIKNYSPEFIDKQVEVGSEIVKDWKYLAQTSVEELNKIYSQPDFDPETRLYCFKEDKLVGFLTGKAVESEGESIGWIRFPFVLDEYEEVKDLLMEYIMKVFQDRGIKKVQGVAGTIWGDSMEIAEKWGFQNISDRAVAYILKVEDFPLKEKAGSSEITNFDYESDLEQMLEIYEKELNIPMERAKANFDFIKNFDRVIAHVIIKDDENILSQSLVYKDEEPDVALLAHSFVKKQDHYTTLIQHMVEKCKGEGIKIIKTFFRENHFDIMSEYEKIGFEFESKTVLMEKGI